MERLKQLWQWFDDRTGLSEAIGPMLAHPVPKGSTWAYVFGSATLFAFMLQVVTGIALATAYVPSTDGAYESLLFISNQALFGSVLRGLHNFGASAMIILIGIHTIRVFLFAAYKFPREFNWLTGLVLLAATLGMAFTGQLVRWDQDGLWSVFIAANMAGRMPFVGPWLSDFILAGQTVGATTLSRFYSFHVFFIPAVLFLFIGAHLYLVLRNGISEPPKLGRVVDPKTYRDWYHHMLDREGVPFWPDAGWRDAIFGVIIITIIFLIALFIGPPELGNPPDPTNIVAYPRPDWYFLWLFAALALLPGDIETFFIVIGPVIIALVMLLLPFYANRGERHPLRRPWAMAVVLLVIIMIIPLWYAGARSPWSPDFEAEPLPAAVVNSTEPQIQAGAKLFHQKGCEYCHTISGYGGHRGPDLTTVGDRLSVNQMTWRILGGADLMPAFASTLTPEELDSINAFLQSRTAQSASSSESAAIEETK